MKKRSIRTIVCILLSLLLLAAAAGCTGGQQTSSAAPSSSEAGSSSEASEAEPSSESEPAAEGEPVELSFVTWSASATDQGALQKICDAYTASNPNVTVTMKGVPGTEYDAYLTTSLSAGICEDLYHSRNRGQGASIYESGYIVKMEESKTPVISELPEMFLTEYQTADGEQYALPFSWSSRSMFYNKKIFSDNGIEPPKTWDELLAAYAKLKEAGIVPLALGTKDQWDLGNCFGSQIQASFCGVDWQNKLFAGEADFSDPDFIAHFDLVSKLKEYIPESYSGLGYDDYIQMFGNGMAATIFVGAWEISAFENNYPELEFGLLGTPTAGSREAQVSFSPDWGLAVTKDSKNLDESLKFADWLCREEAQTIMANEMPGRFPVFPGLTAEVTDPIANAWLSNIKEDGSNQVVAWLFTDVIAKQPSGDTLYNEAITGVLDGTMTSEEAAAHIQDGLAQWYKPLQDYLAKQ